MPCYEFRDKSTGEITEVILKISEYDDYKDSNPHLSRIHSAGSLPQLIGGTDTSGGKLPDGFKDKLREIKKKHPGAGGVDHLL
jgi:hypothetical protein